MTKVAGPMLCDRLTAELAASEGAFAACSSTITTEVHDPAEDPELLLELDIAPVLPTLPGLGFLL